MEANWDSSKVQLYGYVHNRCFIHVSKQEGHERERERERSLDFSANRKRQPSYIFVHIPQKKNTKPAVLYTSILSIIPMHAGMNAHLIATDSIDSIP